MRDEAFERLYSEHAKSLLAFLVYRTGDHALSEDLLADTFERVLTARRPFNPRRASEKTWLYTIALNLLRDHGRRASASRRSLDRIHAGAADATGTGGFEEIDKRDAVHRALATLSNDEREVVALRYGADLTVSEIARVIGEKPSTAHGRVYRALRKLKDQLEDGLQD